MPCRRASHPLGARLDVDVLRACLSFEPVDYDALCGICVELKNYVRSAFGGGTIGLRLVRDAPEDHVHHSLSDYLSTQMSSGVFIGASPDTSRAIPETLPESTVPRAQS